MKNVLTKSFLLTVAFSLLCAGRLSAAFDAAAAARSAEQAEKSGQYLKALLEKATDEARQKFPPQPTKPYDSVAAEKSRWLEKKKRLAPQLFKDGQLTAEAETKLNVKASHVAGAKERLSEPKVDGFRHLSQTRSQNHQARSEPQGFSPLGGASPRLELVGILHDPQANVTQFELWLMDGVVGEWWEIFRAPSLQPAAWNATYVGSPDSAFDNVQVFFVYATGLPQQSYFQIFLHQDSDFDGSPDGYEVVLFKTDPLNPDSNANEIADGEEDADGDGLSNLYELSLGTNPVVGQSSTDSDGDGLPNWLESLITFYTGDTNPTATGNSDGDGLNNITEWRLRLDPSWGFDRVLGNYANLPDDQRVVLQRSIELESPLAAFGGGQPLIPADSYFDASFSSYYGTAAQLIVRKDTDANGNFALGTDTFTWGAAYQTPPNFIPAQNIPAPDPADGLVDDESLLLSVTQIFADTWDRAEVTQNLDTLSEPTLIHIQQRSFTRMWVEFRQLQLLMVAEQLPAGVALRVRATLARIHTQATLLRKTTLVIGQQYPSTQALARMGRIVPVVGSVCTVLSFAQDANDLVEIYRQYFFDVQRGCDNNNETALDLALALANVVDTAFPAPVNAAFLWPIWWNAFASFYGYGSDC